MGHPTIFPTFRYRDADAAIRFLKEAFGFEDHGVHRVDDGTVVHAELRFGDGMIMLGSQRDDWMRTRIPDEMGGVTSSPYLVVSDIDAHDDRARAAGAEIVRALQDTDYGSQEYSARDPEGHLWHFGTYDPFAPSHSG
jgi:uncharacterized glyoxalase superfamily protein PhnB